MADQPVLYEVDAGIAWLTINRPEARNALNQAVRAGLWGGFRRFDADPDARVLVLTGTGTEAFSAGADLKEMAESGLKVPPLTSFRFLDGTSRSTSRSSPL